MRRENGELWHRWREGHVAVQGQLEDYAFMIFGLLELYETTLETRYLETALNHNDILTASFRDKKKGGYYMTADTAEELIVRPKELYDGAIPSGNSVQMLNLLKLARLTGRPELEELAADTGKAFSGMINQSPSNFSQALIALQFAAGETVEIVVVGDKEEPETKAMLECIHSVYQPGKVVLLKDSGNAERLAEFAPFTKEQCRVGGKPTVYICRNFGCEQPINTIEALRERLK